MTEKELLNSLEGVGFDLRTDKGRAEMRANIAFIQTTRRRCEKSGKVGWTMLAIIGAGAVFSMANQVWVLLQAGLAK